MRYCKDCKINYEDNIEKCLLCSNNLVIDEEKIEESYPSYIKIKNFNEIFFKIILLTNIISITTTSFVDYYINQKFTFSPIVIAANIYMILFVYILLKRNKFIHRLIFLLIISMLLTISIGLITKNIHWAIDYVMPFMLINNTIILTFVLLTKRKRWQDYTMFLIISAFFNIAIIIFSILKINIVYWPTISSFLYGIITYISLLIFSPKALKEEFLRRFHI